MVLSGTSLLLAACLLGAPAPFAGEVRGAGPPDSARLAKLEREFAEGAVARVLTADGASLLRRVRVSPEGIAGDWLTSSHGAITSFEHEHRLVTWGEIERVERLDNWAGRGAKAGFVAGLVAGIAMAANIHERWGERAGVHYLAFAYPGPADGAPVVERIIVIVATPLLGALTGAFLGSSVPRWRTVGP